MPKIISDNGARLAPDGGWQAHADLIAEAAKQAHKPRVAGPRENLQPGRVHLVWRAPQCEATANSTGQRCKCRVIRGASRCFLHGGLSEVPAHPSNIAAYRDGRIQAKLDANAARKAFYLHEPATRQVVKTAWETAGGAQRRRRAKWTDLLAGAQAISSDDTGRAFQRWLSAIRPIE